MPKEKAAAQRIYELKIPMWNAAIPGDWKMEVQFIGLTGSTAGFIPVAGTEILLRAGALLRGNGGPEEECLERMVEQNFAVIQEQKQKE